MRGLIWKTLASTLVITVAFAFMGCLGSKKTRYEAEFLGLFNTVTKIVAYSDSREEFTNYAQMIHDALKEYCELYDIYNNYEGVSNIKTINDNAGVAPVKVDKKIIDLIKFAKQKYYETNGKMNIAFGAVLKIWHDYREAGIEDPENAALPPGSMLKEAAKHTDIEKVIIDEEESTVFLEDPYMSLDVGAVAKGYAVEQVSIYAQGNGFTSGIISVGGNVRTIGCKDDGSPWNIGIMKPDKGLSDESIKTVYVSDASVVTSGGYQRYYTVDGKDYNHIIDPDTLYPAQYFSSVTIICPDSGTADALSTALFTMPYEEGLKLIDGIPCANALWVMPDGELKYSTDFKDIEKK